MRIPLPPPRGPRRVAMAAAAALAALAPAMAMACGACDEDKVAATYDHGVVVRAAAGGEVIVFCAISGRFDAARLKTAASRVRGIRPASVRVSIEPAALSFAVDPKRSSARAAVDSARRAMAPGVGLTVVRFVVPARALLP